MVSAKGTSMLKSDFSTRHSIFKIRSLRPRSFGIRANLFNYCGSIVVNGSNERRLTNDGSLNTLVVGHVGRS